MTTPDLRVTDPDPDTPDFTEAIDPPSSMTSKALGGRVGSLATDAHTHEAHPTVWVQQRDPRWADDDHTQRNLLLRIGDLWVDKDYADYSLSDGWGTQFPYTRIFDGNDWREVASASSTAPKLSYTHVQSTPASTWTVVHDLGYRPNVTVVDTADTAIIPGVTYTDVNTVTLHFAGATAGKAYCS